MIELLSEVLVSALILVGAFFTLVGSLGLTRLRDFFARLHGPTKATTLGVGSLLLASLVFIALEGDGLRLHKVLIAIFLFLTAPVSAHLLAKAAICLKVGTGPAGEVPETFDATQSLEIPRDPVSTPPAT
ncbi:MAG: Na+/H+ antiporter subunit G [Deltaproteobacteria bacterium]|nr:MAG: Na+/H+ antiporter subunit G [Deltaproteobacteria bacterium]